MPPAPFHRICSSSNRTTYNECLKYLSKGKSPSFDNILDNILKALPPQLHDIPMFQAILLPNLYQTHGNIAKPRTYTKR